MLVTNPRSSTGTRSAVGSSGFAVKLRRGWTMLRSCCHRRDILRFFGWHYRERSETPMGNPVRCFHAMLNLHAGLTSAARFSATRLISTSRDRSSTRTLRRESLFSFRSLLSVTATGSDGGLTVLGVCGSGRGGASRRGSSDSHANGLSGFIVWVHAHGRSGEETAGRCWDISADTLGERRASESSGIRQVSGNSSPKRT
jgi:hypothetical protein